MKQIIVMIVMNFVCLLVNAHINAITDSTNFKIKLPLDYKISFARLDSVNYPKDLNAYSKFVTSFMRKTQMSLGMVDKDIRYEVTPNSIYPTAQLDTNTLIKNPNDLIGKWEMLTFRMIEFKDSIDLERNLYYRKTPVLITENKDDIAYATFTDKKYKLFLKDNNTNEYAKAEGARYVLENNRNIVLYKLFKSTGGISQIGIDENGYLIINYPKVVTETNRKDFSHSYITTITQKIFKRIKE